MEEGKIGRAGGRFISLRPDARSLTVFYYNMMFITFLDSLLCEVVDSNILQII